MQLLVLGGTRHVGRALVESALSSGHRVTTVNRGLSRAADPAVDTLVADRTVPGDLAATLAGRRFDMVLDTWSGAPVVVRESAALLAGCADRYAYVSSRSVHRWPIPSGADESAPLVTSAPDLGADVDYPAAKRGGELAVAEHFPDNHLLARAGLIIGPYEQVARLPWWLRRIRSGGRVLAPGRPERGLQYIDGRDLADWMIATDAVGPVSAVGPPGAYTMGDVIAESIRVTESDAEPVWVPAEILAAHGIQGWTDLPIWLPEGEDTAGLHDGDHRRALASGLRQRPLTDTVADTWRWLLAEGYPPRTAEIGLDPEVERAALRAFDETSC